MVVLTPRFTVLLALSSLALISLSPAEVQAAPTQPSQALKGPQTPATRLFVPLPNASGRSHAAANNDGKSTGKSAPKVESQSGSKTKKHDEKEGKGMGEDDKKEGKKDKHDKRALSSSFDPLNPLLRMGDIFIRKRSPLPNPVRVSRPYHHDPYTKATFNGEDAHVHFGRSPLPHHHHNGKVIVKGDHDRVNVHARTLSRFFRRHEDEVVVSGDDEHVHIHGHDEHEKVVIKGDDDHVHVHRSPSPEPHHHDYYDHDHEKVIVEGDHDHVNVHERSPHHHDEYRHGEVVVKGDDDHVDVHKRSHHHHEKVIVDGDHDHVSIHKAKRSILLAGQDSKSYIVDSHAKRAQSVEKVLSDSRRVMKRDSVDASILDMGLGLGVPGTVDIMSAVASPPYASKIASLVLASMDPAGTYSSLDSSNSSSANSTAGNGTFVLNVSETKQTRMFLVPISSAGSGAGVADVSSESADSSDSPSITSISTVTSTITTTITTTSTSSSSAAFPSPSASSESEDIPATTSLSSDSEDADDIPVTLQIPVFDSKQARMVNYCATFDPSPLKPVVMSVEECVPAFQAAAADGTSAASGSKSQVFSYSPTTGVVRPMWYAGEDDGMGGGAAAASSATSDSDSTTSSASDSYPATSSDETDDGDSNTEADGGEDDGEESDDGAVDPTTPEDADVASVTDVSSEFGNDTRMPQAFDATSTEDGTDSELGSAAPMNVTLVFTPEAPVVSGQSDSGDASSEADDTPDGSSAKDGLDDSSISTTATTISTTTTVMATATATATAQDAFPTDTLTTSSESSTTTTAAATATAQDVLSTDTSTTSSSDTSSPTSTSADPSLQLQVVAATPSPSSTDGSSTPSSASAAAMSSMTPVSTAPYEWMFTPSAV